MKSSKALRPRAHLWSDDVGAREALEATYCVAIAAASSVVLRNGTLLDRVGAAGTFSGTIHMSSTGSLTMDHAQISNSPGSAIWVDMLATAPTLNFIQSTISNNLAAGIVSGYGFVGTPVSLVADGLSLSNNKYGIYWFGAPATAFDLRNSTVSGSTAIGITVDSPAGATFKLRGSTVSGNTTDGLSLAGTMTADLGTSADAGGNNFSGNAAAGLHTSLTNQGLSVDAVGNTWAANEPAAGGVPATSALGSYPANTAVTGPKAHGKNFKIDTASTLKL